MEEDIEILRGTLVSYCYNNCKGAKDDTCKECKRLKAIEHTVNRLEQDERVIEKMASYLVWEYEEYNEIEEVIDHFRKKCE